MDPDLDQHTPNQEAVVIPTNDKNIPKKPLLKFPFMPVFIFSLLILSVLSILLYFFYLYPRINTTKIAQNIKEEVKNLSTSVRNLRISIDKIKIITTEEWNMDTPLPLEVSGLILHPNISSLSINSAVLGVEIEPLGIVEKNTINFSEKVKGSFNPLLPYSENIAGITTVAENPFVSQLRELKNESFQAEESSKKAQTELEKVLTLSTENINFITSLAKSTLAQNATLEEKVSPYIEQALKVSSYYQALSQMLIDMNDKISSFQLAIQSAGKALNEDVKGANFALLQTQLKQAQVFVDQAKKDTQEIKTLSDQLKNTSENNLPLASADYHQHNIEVIQAVTDYFTSVSGYLDEMLRSTGTLIDKMQNGKFTSTDLISYQNSIIQTTQNSTTAETKFASDLQSLINEEQSLTLSFWQNNTILSQGADVEGIIDNFDKNLTKILSDSKIPVINN